METCSVQYVLNTYFFNKFASWVYIYWLIKKAVGCRDNAWSCLYHSVRTINIFILNLQKSDH